MNLSNRKEKRLYVNYKKTSTDYMLKFKQMRIHQQNSYAQIFVCYLRGENDLERERAGRRTGGERLLLRVTGDLLVGGGLLGRLRGELSEKKQIIYDYLDTN